MYYANVVHLVLVGEEDPASAEAWLMADSEITSRDKAGVPRILEAQRFDQMRQQSHPAWKHAWLACVPVSPAAKGQQQA